MFWKPVWKFTENEIKENSGQINPPFLVFFHKSWNNSLNMQKLQIFFSKVLGLKLSTKWAEWQYVPTVYRVNKFSCFFSWSFKLSYTLMCKTQTDTCQVVFKQFFFNFFSNLYFSLKTKLFFPQLLPDNMFRGLVRNKFRISWVTK